MKLFELHAQGSFGNRKTNSTNSCFNRFKDTHDRCHIFSKREFMANKSSLIFQISFSMTVYLPHISSANTVKDSIQ